MNDYLACGKCGEFLLVVSPSNELTTEIMEQGGVIDSVYVFECPNKEGKDEHTRITLDLLKIIETGKLVE